MPNAPRRALDWWRRSDKRVRMSAAVLASVLFGWPATSTAQALGFPIFEQTMLALSWFAPAITALDLLFTSQLHEKQDDQDAGGDAGGDAGPGRSDHVQQAQAAHPRPVRAAGDDATPTGRRSR